MSSYSSSIAINSKNFLQGSTNKFIYNFPSPVKFQKGDTLTIQECSIYNQFFNITALNGNNTFSIRWNANTITQYNFVIPDSYLDVTDINAYIKQQCILNKLYMIETATGQYISFIELKTNPSRYATEFYMIPLPTSSQAASLGYTIPAGATWSYPVSSSVPQIIITTGFGKLIGFEAATYPSATQQTNYEVISQITPEIVIITNILIGCNLVNNPYSIPSNIVTAFPIASAFGSLLTYLNANASYCSIHDGFYHQIVIDFYDQDYKPLYIREKKY